MKDTEVIVSIDPLSVLSTEIRDNRIGNYRTDRFKWHGIAIVEWGEAKLPCFVVAAAKFNDDAEGAKQVAAVGLSSGAKNGLLRGWLSAFSENEIIGLKATAAPAKTSEAVTISAETFAKLEREFAHHAAAKKCFQETVNKLQAIGEYGPSPEDSLLVSHLERMLDAAYLGRMTSWYREKIGRIRRDINEMLGRKNRSHDGCRAALSDLRDSLYGFHPPDAWLRHPPIRK